MKKYGIYALAVAVLVIGGCTSKKTATTGHEGHGEAAATSSPATAAAAQPSGSGTPMVQGTIPPQIPEILRRPLTPEEIMRLPPETRDMILRAQGKPVPSPTKKK